VEFIRVNPRPILGLSNAQIVSLLSVVAAVILFADSAPAIAGRKEGAGQVIGAVTPGRHSIMVKKSLW
jgi:hypothetical protein